jgi:cation diffusion facilitator CzcD-associated flavoprotein CzcO
VLPVSPFAARSKRSEPAVELPKACIIGAGSSGIAGAKVLHERGIPFDCLEASDRVGGNWVFGNKNGMSSSYRTLHINTSRERMEYSDFPMPKSYPDFPHHTHIAQYFNDYVDHFGFRDKIAFDTAVEHAARRDDGVWEVAVAGGGTRVYDALFVANGHHWDPRWPEPRFPGTFDGTEMHAHHYTDQDAFRDKRVVIVGMGNSAMDLAVDSSYVAERTFLAARRGAHVIPKYLGGKPVDQPWRQGRLGALLANPRIPYAVRRRMLEKTLEAQVGRMEDYGLPKPDHRVGEAHPTVSGRILDRIVHGTITPKPNIAELQGDRVKFDDGSVEEADVIVYCTGYKVSFPFFDQDFISAPDNDLPLFRRVFHPEIGGVFFLSLLQPLGATMPIAEAQAKWVADYLRGLYALPPSDELRDDMESERARMFKRYVASKRHTMQIDFDDYLFELEKERRRGGARARERGYRLPIPPRAGAAVQVGVQA